MAYLDYRNRIKRVDFSKNEKVQEIPNLIQVQQESYAEFLQADVPPEKRRDVGLQTVFKGIFPITDYNGRASLEFLSYAIGELKWSEEECRERGVTYAAPIKVTVQLVIFDVDEKTGARTIRDVKEQEVFFGEIPLMSERATFIINGTERVIVSQLHRSPGVFFEHDKGRSHASGKVLFSARIIPYRGSWLDFEFDHKDALYIKIDRKRKFPIAVLLRAFGRTTEELLRIFYDAEEVTLQGEKYAKDFRPELMVGLKMPVEVRHPGKPGEIAFKKGVKISKKRVERYASEGVAFGRILLPSDDLIGKVVVSDVADPATGEVVVECGQQITPEILGKLWEKNVERLSIFTLENSDRAVWEGLVSDKIKTRDEALKEIYKKMRPGDPPTKDAAKTLFENMFFNPERYSLSRVGRLKLDHKLGITESDLEKTVLTQEDILRVIRYLIGLKNGVGEADDIDNLGNRRVRTVGELIENQFRMGLVRVERAIREKMGLQDIETLMPHDIINAKPVSAVIKEFFGSSQLSQFMDQTNPLSEVTHKRRVSALGPGGLTRERAGFEVRDVHPTHYGRICPIETPEGPNIGLIASLSTFARINEFGFIETPYRVVKESAVTKEIVFLSAMEEERHVIAQANAAIDAKGKFVQDVVIARQGGEFAMVRSADVTLMDVSPNQLVSVAASLVPFLEHDDANRALMGSNMQRQAVPLLRTEPPFVGTGMESVVARDSGAAVAAKRSGVVEGVDARRIVVRSEEPDASGMYGADIYTLVKYRRSNQNTCINQKPIVTLGQKVSGGEVIADGPATSEGDLALGRNVLVAFMPWGGYNFEDSILISEKIVKEDIFTSIHIEEFECVARETKLGKEEISADIPNISEESLTDLDESGIIRIGARVKPMDILVGKITPKGETQLSPEEKLLRAIFGDKAGDVKDSSLRVPPGIEGIVIDAKVFTRKGGEKDDRARMLEDRDLERLYRDQEDETRIILDAALGKIRAPAAGEDLRRPAHLGGQVRGAPREAEEDHGRGAGRNPEGALGRDRRRGRSGAEGPSFRRLARLPGPGGARQGDVRRKDLPDPPRRRASPRRPQDGEGVHRDEAEALRRRQDGGPPREQGRHLPDPSGRGHAVHRRRRAGRRGVESARGPLAHERRADPRGAPRVGRQGTRGAAPADDGEGVQHRLRCGSGSARSTTPSGSGRTSRSSPTTSCGRSSGRCTAGCSSPPPCSAGRRKARSRITCVSRGSRSAARRCSTTGGPGRRSSRRSPSARCTC